MRRLCKAPRLLKVRFGFWSQAMKRGLAWMNAVAGWFGLIVLILGVGAGIAVPLVFSVSHWLTAVILLAAFIVLMLEGTYRVWEKTDQNREATGESLEASGKEIGKPTLSPLILFTPEQGVMLSASVTAGDMTEVIQWEGLPNRQQTRHPDSGDKKRS